jgi:diguanylate cyclase (GGDEF)-like protein/PAS domain S-box-containing protein
VQGLRDLRAAVASAAAMARRLACEADEALLPAIGDLLHDAATSRHTFVLVRLEGSLRLAGYRSRDAQPPDGARLEHTAQRLLECMQAGEMLELRLDGLPCAVLPLCADGREVLGALCLSLEPDTRIDAAALAELAAAAAARLARAHAAAGGEAWTPDDAPRHAFGAHGVLPGPLAGEHGLLRTLIDAMPDQIYAKDVNGRFLIANKAAAVVILGAPDTQRLIGKSDLDFYPLASGQRFFTDEQQIIRTGVPVVDQIEENLNGDGTLRFFSTTKYPFRDEKGQIGGIVGISRDITLRVGADEAARLRDRAVESSQDGIVITSCTGGDHPIVYINPAFERITGFGLGDAVRAGIERFLLEQDELQQAAGRKPDREALIAGIGERRVLRSWHRDGTAFWSEVRLAVIRAADGAATHHVFTITDVTDAQQAEEALTLLASRDPLTGLPNRRNLMAKLAQAVQLADAGDLQVAVAFIDLDGLKRLNDEHGHEAGDVLLRTVAERIASCIRQSDTVARLGGDEFVLVTLHRTGQAGGDPEGVAEVLRKILQRIAQPIRIGEIVTQASCSIGVALYGRHGKEPETLLRRADEAMYAAKKSGRNRIVFA